MNHDRMFLVTGVRAFLAVVLACVLTGSLTSASSRAGCPLAPPASLLETGEVGLFFDAAGTVTCADVPQAVFVPIYLVARMPEGGVASYSISELLVAAGVVITSGALPAGAPFVAQFYADACNTAVRIDPQSCPTAEGELRVLAVYQVMFFTTTGHVCFQTACPTIAGTVAMNPYYTRCDTGEWGQLVGGESMCLGLGVSVSVDTGTWGRIKSLYNGD